jgi:preprotein translocase subunit SecF
MLKERAKMRLKAVSGIMLTMLLVGILTSTFDLQIERVGGASSSVSYQPPARAQAWKGQPRLNLRSAKLTTWGSMTESSSRARVLQSC